MMQQKLKQITRIEVLALLTTLLAVTFLQPSAKQLDVAWEIIPALSAAVITVYGLKKMNEMT